MINLKNESCFGSGDALEPCTQRHIDNIPSGVFTLRVLQGKHQPQLSLAVHLHPRAGRFGNENQLECLGIRQLRVGPESLEVLLHLGS